MLKTTPLHPRTAPLVRAQTWRRWAGYQVASSYDPHPDREYASVRNAVALFDVSPLHKYLITGPDAVRLLDRMVTRDMTRCQVGQVYYTTWCDRDGKVVDDGTVSRIDEGTFRLTAAEPNMRWLTMNSVGLKVEIEDISESTAALALQGPLARHVLARLSDADWDGLKYFRLLHTAIANVPVTVSRTGYTGDLGYEIWIPAGHAVEVWDALMTQGKGFGITPAGIWALDIARIEAGLVMLDVDYHPSHRALIGDQKSTPFELGLGWTVAKQKGPYNGRRALNAERLAGPAWSLVGLAVDWPSFEAIHGAHRLPAHVPTVAWRTSTPVYSDGKQVGYASSGCWSPLLKQYIALAHVRRPFARVGTTVRMEVTVEHQRRQAKAIVSKLPFFDPERKRA